MPSSGATATAIAVVTPLPTSTAAPRPTTTDGQSNLGACVNLTLGRLTEDQRVGQLFLLGLSGSALTADEEAAILDGHLGSVWLVGARTTGVATTASLTAAVQRLAPRATGGVGFLVGTDQEGGLVQRLSGPGFSVIPSALFQGSWSAATLRADAAAWGRQLVAAGVNLDLAPVVDVVPPGGEAWNAPIGELNREFGFDSATVGAHGAVFVEGMADAGVAATLKHFPGLGRVTGNTDFTGGVVDRVTTRDDPDLASFRAGIAAGAQFVMISLATYARIDPLRPAAFSPTVIQGMLRGELGFQGVVVSDSLGDAAAVAAVPPATRALDFVAAGGDLIVVERPAVAVTMAAALRARAASDPAFRAIVDAAARHVLAAKAAAGLVACRG